MCKYAGVFGKKYFLNMKFSHSQIECVKLSLQIYATLTSNLWHPGWQGSVAMPVN